MTYKEYKEKYPLGTKVKYYPPLHHNLPEVTEDRNKIGRIVGFSRHDHPIIFLPESEHISLMSTEQVPASWSTSWGYLKILPQKNEQLLFAFMSGD